MMIDAVKSEFTDLIQTLFPDTGYQPVQNSKVTVAVAAADHLATLQSIKQAFDAGIADFLLFGDTENIRKIANLGNIDIRDFETVNCSGPKEAAEKAVLAAADGSAHVLMKGGVHTSVFTSAFLDKTKGLVPKGGLISHTALFKLTGYKKPFLLTDGAINTRQDFEKKKKILFNAVQVARALGILRPSVACICPVETVNPKIISTVDAEKLVQCQNSTRFFGDAVIEGPMALDVAFSSEAAKVKSLAGKVPGDPDILLMPNLDAGNVLYKSFSVQQGSLTAGIIAGLRVPVVLTSRSDNNTTRFLSLYMALAVSAGMVETV
ncbi:MAG: phosphate butyryltransferase [Bacteroidetes bacterium]|nr:phosphate butyryltransferase [Bacteroidota bacterium]